MAISDFIRLRKLGLPFQTFLHIVHRLFQAAVHDPRIMLRHACGGMSEHDGHVLQGYIVGERDGRPETVNLKSGNQKLNVIHTDTIICVVWWL